MADAVQKSINNTDLRKDSALHTFRRTLENNLNRYLEGIKKNEKEQRRYNRSKAKHDKIVAKGKNPGWKVVPLDLIDLDWAQDKFTETATRMLDRLEQLDLRDAETNYDDKATRLIQHSSELAERAANTISPTMARDHAINLMREVGIPQPELRFKQYPFELSGGMRQRIVIAIALCSNPDVLICDEPTTALDVTIQAQILELINNLQKERGLSIIFITHDLGVVANMADRIAVMYAGKIVEIGDVDEVFYEPAHPYTWALLSSMPDLETKEKLMAIPGTPPNMLMPPVGDAFAERNHYAMKIDFEEQPPMFKISDTHYAATWLLAPGAPAVEPPPIVTERIERMKAREAANAR
ncbi:MAG: ATP-binding cassette domain-containing protein [Eubacteriales bacterium]|nr:ATP-binding cassette domain-containing protein [Eubacteriales bacterium]